MIKQAKFLILVTGNVDFSADNISDILQLTE